MSKKIDEKIIVEALGDARADIAKITLAAHMIGEQNLDYDQKSLIKRFQQFEKDIHQFEKNCFNDWMTIEIGKLNRKYKCGTKMGVMVTMQPTCIYMCGEEAIFMFKDNGKGDMERFEEEREQLSLKVKEAADMIDANFAIVHRVCEEACSELRKQDFIRNKGSIRYEICLNGKTENLLQMTFTYMNRERCTYTVNISKQVEEEFFLKEVSTKLIAAMKTKIVQDRTKSINQRIAEICKEQGLRATEFTSFLKDAPKPWDFEEGYISYDLDLSDDKTKFRFARDLMSCVKAVEALYFSTFDHITANKNIKVGSDYYYYKKDTKELNGETYDIYEGRVGNRKPINFLVKDGQRIFGRKRNKIMRELGLGRKD